MAHNFTLYYPKFYQAPKKVPDTVALLVETRSVVKPRPLFTVLC